jgi:hypothetical protein
VTKFCTSLLQAAAPTLEKLSWKSFRSYKQSFDSNVIHFPRLRTLSLSTICTSDDTVLSAFFPSDADNHPALRSVSIDDASDCAWEFLAQRGHIQGLEALRLHSLTCPKAPFIAFLSANPQLKFLMTRLHTPEYLTGTLLPLLASDFKFLTSLVLSSTPNKIGPRSMVAIGRLSSLTSLWLVEEGRYEHLEWVADNAPTIAALSPLRNLTRLALSREYSVNTVHVTADHYFALVNGNYPQGGLLGEVEADREKWESWHKEKVWAVVKQYAHVFERLRWIYLGQLVFRIVGNVIVPEDGGRKQYYPAKLWESPDWCR